MTELCLGFKAFDIHELLCHFVAQQAGLYRDCGIQVKLLDTNFVADAQLPENCMQVACGAALNSWLQGAPLKVVFVATDKPMFWLYANAGIKVLADLMGERVAGFPAAAPPAHFLTEILAVAGITNEKVIVEAARDDTARLGLLVSGDVAASVLSSAIPPAVMTNMGFQALLFFGDHLRIPTTGLAVTESMLHKQGQLVADTVEIFQQSLKLIHTDDELVKYVLAKQFRVAESLLMETCGLVQASFTKKGLSSVATTQSAVSLMGQLLGISEQDFPCNGLYDFHYLDAYGGIS